MNTEEIKDTGVENEAPLNEEETGAEGNPEEMEELLAAEAEAERRAALKRTVIKEIKEWAVALVTAVVVVLVVKCFLFTVIRVDGNSMLPTLVNNERLFVTVADAKLGYIDRDDVVICKYPNRGNTYFVKRVLGMPGDVVERKMGVTFINGAPVDPRGIMYQVPYDYEPYTLKDNEYFCVGDNLYDSHDSRDWNDGISSGDVGPLDEDMIVGKVRYVFWPLNKIRPVE